jgi:hypothetical protein
LRIKNLVAVSSRLNLFRRAKSHWWKRHCGTRSVYVDFVVLRPDLKIFGREGT